MVWDQPGSHGGSAARVHPPLSHYVGLIKPGGDAMQPWTGGGGVSHRGGYLMELGYALSLGVVWGRPGRPSASAARVHPLLSPHGGHI